MDAAASAGLPCSQATKLIFDRGNVIAEGTGDLNVHYNYYEPFMTFSLSEGYLRNGEVMIGGGMAGGMGGPGGSAKVDVMQMSFVLELVEGDGMAMDPMDAVWYRESSASLLGKVDQIRGSIVIRELHASERMQMNKFKRSPHESSHQFRMVYKNGATHIQSNVKATWDLNYNVMGDMINLYTTQDRVNPVSKSASLMGIDGKSFVIQDAARSNCENLSSSGIEANCNGNIWIERL